MSDLSKDSTVNGKFLSEPRFVFTLEAYANDTHTPNILPKEVDIALGHTIDKECYQLSINSLLISFQ